MNVVVFRVEVVLIQSNWCISTKNHFRRKMIILVYKEADMYIDFVLAKHSKVL